MLAPLGWALLLAAAAPLQAAETAAGTTEHRPEWVHVPASDSNIDFYLDRASVRAEGDEVEFWDVVIFRQPSQRDEPSNRMIKEKRTLRRVRCHTAEQALIRGASFDEGGHLIEAVSLSAAGATFTPVRPATVAASELYRACREAGIEVPTVLPASPDAAAGH